MTLFHEQILRTMTIPAEDIWKIEPEMADIGGEAVYTKPIQA